MTIQQKTFAINSIVSACFVFAALSFVHAGETAKTQPPPPAAVLEPLDPKCYDIFAGKKERLYLMGPWQEKAQYPGSYKTPDVPDDKNDAGIKEGYWKSDFNDQSWKMNVLPAEYKSWQKVLAWCRMGVYIPSKYSGKRFLLHFERVNSHVMIWVNGKFVMERLEPLHLLAPYDVSPFEADITPFVETGKENMIAIRVFSNTVRNNGLVMPVWIDVVPPVYSQRMLITSDIHAGKIHVAADVVNTFEKKKEIKLSAHVEDWASDRYRPKNAAPATSANLGRYTLLPGENKIEFDVKIDNPALWSFDDPHLYEFKLKADDEVIGRERFGMKEFVAKGGRFYLNGTKVMLMGEAAGMHAEQITSALYKRSLVLGFNYYENIIKAFKKANANWNRPSRVFARAFVDVSDELGFGLYLPVAGCGHYYIGGTGGGYGTPDSLDASGNLKKDVEDNVIKPYLHEWYNHPSVIAYNLGNELYDSSTLKFAPSLTKWYEAFKKYDAIHPVSHGSGRRSKDDKSPTDFFDTHQYRASGLIGVYASLEDTLRRFPFGNSGKEDYVKIYGEKPMVNGEGIRFDYYGFKNEKTKISGMAHRCSADPKLRAVIEDVLATGDRKAYAELLRRSSEYEFQFGSLGSYGLRDYLDAEKANPLRGIAFKRMIECHRRASADDTVAGFLYFQSNLFTGFDIPFNDQRGWWYPVPGSAESREKIRDYIRDACSPIMVCADIFDRNIISGNKIKPRIFIFNDSCADELSAPQVEVSLADKEGSSLLKETLKTKALKPGSSEMVAFEASIPVNARTGEYKLELILKDRGLILSRNEERVYVLNRDEYLRPIAASGEFAVYKPQKLGDILESLGISFSEIHDFKDLDAFDALIIAPDSIADGVMASSADTIREWIAKGGKLVCLEQSAMKRIPWMPQVYISNSGALSFAQLVLEKHPLFDGLGQSVWDTWNGNSHEIYNFLLKPVRASMLMCGQEDYPHPRFGMVVSETRMGKGLVLLSQVDACRRYGEDAAATKYIRNLLGYCLTGKWDGKDAVKDETGSEAQSSGLVKVDVKKCAPVCISNYCNMGFVDETSGDRKGGWADDGAEDCFEIPTGRQILAGVPFDIIDPARNNGKSCIVLRGGPKKFFPEAARDMVVNRKAKRLFFLMSAAYCRRDAGEIARIVIHYEGGTVLVSETILPIVSGVNISEWTDMLYDLPGAHVGWITFVESRKRVCGCYVLEFANPQPEGKITSIDFVSGNGSAVPILIGMTVEVD